MYDYLIVPLLLFALGYVAGQIVERLLGRLDRQDVELDRQREAGEPIINILGVAPPPPYDWAKEDGDD